MFIEHHHISLEHLRRQREGLKGSAALGAAILACVNRDARREGAKKVVGSGGPARLAGQTFARDAEFSQRQSKMAHRRWKSAGAALNMNEVDTAACMAESSIGQFPVAAEGFSVKGFEQSEQNRHGTFAVLHRFTSYWQVVPRRGYRP